MARRTDGDKIDELEKSVAILNEQIGALHRELDELRFNLREVVRDFQHEREEQGRRFTTYGFALFAGIASAVVISAFAYFLTRP